MIKTKKCTDIVNNQKRFAFTKENPDEECINCILDDILSFKEERNWEALISLYREGKMMLKCARTGKSYIINKEFFNRIYLP